MRNALFFSLVAVLFHLCGCGLCRTDQCRADLGGDRWNNRQWVAPVAVGLQAYGAAIAAPPPPANPCFVPCPMFYVCIPEVNGLAGMGQCVKQPGSP